MYLCNQLYMLAWGMSEMDDWIHCDKQEDWKEHCLLIPSYKPRGSSWK